GGRGGAPGGEAPARDARLQPLRGGGGGRERGPVVGAVVRGVLRGPESGPRLPQPVERTLGHDTLPAAAYARPCTGYHERGGRFMGMRDLWGPHWIPHGKTGHPGHPRAVVTARQVSRSHLPRSPEAGRRAGRGRPRTSHRPPPGL